jgi:hypothetical protein
MMKKTLFLTALAICALSLVAEEVTGGGASTMDVSKYRNVGLLDTSAYSNRVKTNDKYADYLATAFMTNMDETLRIAGLSGDVYDFDTAEEITLLSATAGVINIRPVEAARMLPADDPVLVDLQLGAMLYMKKAAVSFLGNGDPAKYAAELKFITYCGRITNADIENFVKQGIAEVVDEEFGKIYFMIDRNYNAILAYNNRTHTYKLTYTDAKDVTKEIQARDLDDLRAKMTASRDFTADGVTLAVNEKAGYIPAVVYANWLANGISKGVDAVALVKEAIAKFYLEPTKTNYDTLAGIYARYYMLKGGIFSDTTYFYDGALGSFGGSLLALSKQLLDSISEYVIKSPNRNALARIPADSRYNVFSIPAGGGGR